VSRPAPQCSSLVLKGLLLAAVCVVFAGCGYSHQNLFPDQYQTVHVPVFKNRTFYRNVEADLTEALIKEIEVRTPYKTVSGNGAQTVIEGEIRTISQNRLSRTPDGGLPQEMEVRMTVDITWKNASTGEIIRQRQGLVDVGRYKPPYPAGETIDVARHEMVQRMAQRIVGVMRDDF